MTEYLIPPDSLMIGRQLAQAKLPDTARVMMIRRYDHYLVPSGRTRLRREDVVVMLVDRDGERLLEAQGQLRRLDAIPAVCRWPETAEETGEDEATGDEAG